MIESKACRTCLQVKPITEFHKRLQDWSLHCKDCANQKRRNWYVNNREVELLRAGKYRKDNPEAMKQRRRAWKQANKEKNVASAVAYGRRNPDKRAIATKKYRDSHRELYNNYYLQRKTKMMSCKAYKISEQELLKLYRNPCVACGSTEKQSLDHIIPVDLGGSHSIGNLQTLCLSCNSSKRNRVMTVWRKSLTAKLPKKKEN
jgi:5-methylcytosine-specific restriction endonuclease McrA